MLVVDSIEPELESGIPDLKPNPVQSVDDPADLIEYEVVQKIFQELPYGPSHRLFSRTHSHVFSGASFVQTCLSASQEFFPTESDAIRFGTSLIHRDCLHGIGKDSAVSSLDLDAQYEFTLHSQETDVRRVLNLSMLAIESSKNAVDISKSLQASALSIHSSFISQKEVDYDELRESEEFRSYLQAASRLQRLDLTQLSETARKTLFINIYNALVIHGFIVNGFPKNLISQLRFFQTTKYFIGGFVFSLNDIEHGILRSNAVPPAALRRQFGRSDPRRRFVLSVLDPRIHFSLNCGSLGCPKIRIFSVEEIDEQLTNVAEGFVRSDVSVVSAHKVALSKIFKWYRGDFGANWRERLEWIANFATGDDQQELVGVLRNPATSISFVPYDWSHNKKT